MSKDRLTACSLLRKYGTSYLQTMNLIVKVCSLYFLFLTVNLCAAPADSVKKIDNLIATLHEQGQFNGSILVSVGGTVLYRKAFGEANIELHQKFTPSTVSCLASVAKQFVAMSVMMLAEQGKLNYDDEISMYFPEITSFARGITIRHLLTHTSGIPDVGDLGIDRPGLSTSDVLKAMKRHHSHFRKPGLRYHYSNTGYILLEAIVAKVSEQKYADFLSAHILTPLDMRNTFLYERKQPTPANVALGYNPYGELDGLAEGMYSTVDDLLKWENALRTDILVRQSALDTAFTPYPVQEGISTYGFGWNIASKDGSKFIWHTGNTGTYRAFIGRTFPEKIAVIILTNKGNSKRMEINDAIVNIIRGKPFTFPTIPIAQKMYDAINNHGVDYALKMYDSLRESHSKRYDFGESELNLLGYKLMSEKRLGEVIKIFELNTIIYPSSSNAFDSLAEACNKSGSKALAIKYYQKAIELDPSNLNSINMLEKLEKR